MARLHNIATIISAGVVFATFVIQENLSDATKNAVDSISSARTNFYVRAGIGNITDRIIVLENLIVTITDSIGHTKPRVTAYPETWLGVRAALFSVGEQQREISYLIASQRLFINALPNHADLVLSLSHYAARSDQVENQQARMVHEVDGATGSMISLLPPPGYYFDHVGPLSAASFKLRDDIGSFGRMILARSERAEQDAEERLRWVRRLSWFVFLIGWAVGLWAQLAGSASREPHT